MHGILTYICLMLIDIVVEVILLVWPWTSCGTVLPVVVVEADVVLEVTVVGTYN